MLSTSRTNGISAAPVPAKAAPKQWQFVNVHEPKKIQDKDVISIVRAHAMRNVRRKQRLELTAQHQKTIKAMTSQPHHADSGLTVKHSSQTDPYDGLIGGKGHTDWLVALRGMFSNLEIINLGHLASDCDEYAQQLDNSQSYDEDEIQASKQYILGACRAGTPKSFVGDGVFDPFNATPISEGSNYNSHVLNHCTCLLRNTFLIGPRRMNASVLRLLSFTYIVVSVMALNCLPVGERKAQNPLTKIWLPYALQDLTLFLATLTFAEVHLEILSGSYKSHRALLHKGASIKAVNAKLGDREQALSNETIGAVAMLAAMEVCRDRRLLVKHSIN